MINERIQLASSTPTHFNTSQSSAYMSASLLKAGISSAARLQRLKQAEIKDLMNLAKIAEKCKNEVRMNACIDNDSQYNDQLDSIEYEQDFDNYQQQDGMMEQE